MDKKTKIGLFFGISTFAMWGVFPIYFKMLEGVPAAEVLAHRIVWSVVLLFLILKFRKKLANIRRLLRIKSVAILLFSTGALISLNWGIFIYAVGQGQILETSLGYFINPLISILLGAIFLKERLNFAQKISLFIVFVAICVQIWEIGALPIISLVLPLSFALYGLLRKKVRIPSFEGLFIETLLVFPFAFLYLSFLGAGGAGAFGPSFLGFGLFLSGLVTILPLLSFNAATKYLPLSTIGFLQYISPSLSLLIAVFLYNEPLGGAKLFSFCLIWVSLFIAAFGGFRRKNESK